MAVKKFNKIKKLIGDNKVLYEQNEVLSVRIIKTEKEVELKEEIINNLMVLDERQRSERENFLASELNRLQDIIRWFIKPSTAEKKISSPDYLDHPRTRSP